MQKAYKMAKAKQELQFEGLLGLLSQGATGHDQAVL